MRPEAGVHSEVWVVMYSDRCPVVEGNASLRVDAVFVPPRVQDLC